MRTCFRTFLTSAVAMALLVGCDAQEYPPAAPEALVETSAPALVTNSDALASTGKTYLSQVVEVTGTVTWIVNKGGQLVLELNGRVICGFGKKQKQKLGQLRIGDRVTLRGIYDSAPTGRMGPYLTPCIFVP